MQINILCSTKKEDSKMKKHDRQPRGENDVDKKASLHETTDPRNYSISVPEERILRRDLPEMESELSCDSTLRMNSIAS